MSTLLKIDEKLHFITIEVKDLICVCLTNFSETFKCEITKDEAVTKTKQLNRHIEMDDTKILSIISSPTDDVSFNDCLLKFKYKISGVPFRYSWELKRTDSNILIFPLLDALLRLKKQILEFRKLPNSDPKMLDQLPLYSGFDVTKILDDYKNIETLSKTCADMVKIRSPVHRSPSNASKNVNISPRQTKKGRYQSVKRGLFGGAPKQELYDESDSSQVDSQTNETTEDDGNERKRRRTEEVSPNKKSGTSNTRVRNTFKL